VALTLRAAREADARDRLFKHALGTDPEGSFVAQSEDGRVVARAAAVVRGDTLRVLVLEVDERARGEGAGSALLDAVRAYGASRGTRGIEAEIPLVPSALAFAARRRLSVTTLVLSLALDGAPAPLREAGAALAVAPFTPGAGLSGWVAGLENETRGYARTPDWSAWLGAKEARAFAARRGGRPEAAAAVFAAGGTAHVGPLAARTPTAAAAALPLLVAEARRAGAERVTISAASGARLLLDVALSLGFRVTGGTALLGTRPKGDLRRALGSPDFF
jgi:hypothetical protein